MKTATLISATLATVLAVSYNHLCAHVETVVPAAFSAASTPSDTHSAHHRKHQRHHRVLSQAEFDVKKKEKLAKLNQMIIDSKALIDGQTNLDPILKAEAMLKLTAAQQWATIIDGYKDPATHLSRSISLARAELFSIKSSLKPLHEKKEKDQAKEAKKAEARHKHHAELLVQVQKLMDDVTSESAKAALSAENKACLMQMLTVAQEYIKFVTDNPDKSHLNRLIKRANKLLKKAHDFLNMPKDNNAAKTPEAGKSTAATPVATPAVDTKVSAAAPNAVAPTAPAIPTPSTAPASAAAAEKPAPKS